MNQVHCNVIQDLLPLYADGACSPETKLLIEKHLENCQDCRTLLSEMMAQIPSPPPSPTMESKELFRNLRNSILGVILAAAAMISCFVINIGGAWYGGPANGGQFIVTVLYIIFWGVFTVVSHKFSPLVKASFLISLVTFISSANSLVCRLLGSGGFIAAFTSVFASVPFYGLRFILDWTGLYTVVTVLSLIWLVYSAIHLRKLKNTLN